IEELVKEKQKPLKILFVGPNGAGKTTTIAKISEILTKKGYGVVISASDTFRAAAIEQLENHCQRIGVRLIKNKYGADPASVAFDAIKYAKTNNIDFVLIDTAGRQNTNINLIDEMKKIVRVSQPDLKIYVGESIAGNAVIEQVGAFKNAIGLDAAILTKLDCDAKGGTALSLTYSTKIPIIFFGTGQNYSDLKEFETEWIVERIIPN
ncbi:MAG: signal recognition particle-docking protein FtsY, partial [Candidatus Anstonellaceae archaeon]